MAIPSRPLFFYLTFLMQQKMFVLIAYEIGSYRQDSVASAIVMCDLGYFLNAYGGIFGPNHSNFLAKVAQIFCDFLVIWKMQLM